MTKKAVLISGIQIFPTESGGQLRTAQIARQLVEQDYEVFIYSLTGRKHDYLHGRACGQISPSNGISEYVNRNAFFGLLQYLSYRLKLPPLWLSGIPARLPPRKLRRAIEAADLVVADHPYLHPLLRRAGGKKVFNSHNIEFHLWGRGGLASLVKRIEVGALRDSDEIWCCSPADAAAYRALMTIERPVVVLPNAVERIERNEAVRHRIRQQLGIPDSARVLLFSASQYGPNRDALDFLRRFISDHRALFEELDLYLLVVGSVAPEAWRERRQIATGPVPTVEEYFSAADFALNPITHGSGTSLKMLQYRAADLPIFSTEFGARGLGLRANQDYVCFSEDDLSQVLRREIVPRRGRNNHE